MGCFSLFPGVACPPHGPSHQHLFISEYSWWHYYGWSWESQSRGMKAVELGWDNPNIVFTFTFEYENEIEFGKVGNENENEHAGYWEIGKRTDSIGNMSNTVGIKKTNRKHRSVEPNWALQQHNYITRQHQCTYTHTWYMIRWSMSTIEVITKSWHYAVHKYTTLITKSNYKICSTNCRIKIKRWIIKKYKVHSEQSTVQHRRTNCWPNRQAQSAHRHSTEHQKSTSTRPSRRWSFSSGRRGRLRLRRW